MRRLRGLAKHLLIGLIRVVTRHKLYLNRVFWASRDQRYLLAQHDGECFVVQTQDIGVSMGLYTGDAKEHEKAVRALATLSSFRAHQGPVDLFIDVGINLGHVSIPLLKRGYVTKVVGFEPAPDNFRLCRANALINHVDEKLVLHQVAIGARDGAELVMELCDDNFGDHRIRVVANDGAYLESQRKTITVESMTLDSLIPAEASPESTLIWIDVQGYEGFVLQGAKNLLAQGFPVAFEFWPYGLQRTGCLEVLLDALSTRKEFYNLGSTGGAQPIENLRAYYESHLDAHEQHLDLLVL